MCSCVSAEPRTRGCSALLDAPVGRDAQRFLLDALQAALQDMRLSRVDERCEAPLEGAIYGGSTHGENQNGMRPSEHVAEQDEVRRQAVERMRERRRPILLENEMPDPRERHIRRAGASSNSRALREASAAASTQQHERRADEMQTPARPVAMLRQVVRIELARRSRTASAMPDDRSAVASVAFP